MFASPAPMHIPDGFLSVPVAIVLWVLSIGVIVIAFRRLSRDLGEREVPVMGVLAAAIFAGQMLNFTVAGGTSGHLMGAALATILLGPWASIIIMTCVVGIQALLFQDGGLVVLGANIFNMGLIGTAVSYAVYSLFQRLAGGRKWGVLAGSFAAGWTSIIVAALAVALQLAFSGTSRANLAIPAMGGIHALIGIGEGLITFGAVSLVLAARPDLLKAGQAQPRSSAAVWIVGGLVTLALAVVSPLASSHPDGLEWVAEQIGFLETAQDPRFNIIPDYVFPGVSNEAAATILAGIVGAIVVLAIALVVAYSRRRKSA